MALALTTGGQTFNTNSGTKTVTATPAVGDLPIIITAHTGNSSVATPTDDNADGLGTYTLVDSRVKNTSADRLNAYVRDALIGSATSTTYTHAPGASSGGGLAVFRISGGTKYGTAAIVKAGGHGNQAGGGTPAPSLGGSPSSANMILTAVSNAANPAGVTVRTGYTSAYNLGYNTPTTGVRVASLASGETSNPITWGGTSGTDFCALAIELDASTSTAYTLTAAAGSYAITGTAAGLKRGYKLAAASGYYAITGTAAGLKRGYVMACTAGSYVITGTAANFSRALHMVAAAGSYALTGTDAILKRGYIMACAAGAYVITGADATFGRGLRMVADAGSYAISGTAAGLKRGYTLAAAVGSYILTGIDATLTAAIRYYSPDPPERQRIFMAAGMQRVFTVPRVGMIAGASTATRTLLGRGRARVVVPGASPSRTYTVPKLTREH